MPLTLFNAADNDYFRTMRIPLLAGRVFDDSDHAAGPVTTIINQEIASKWWPNAAAAIGEQIKWGGPYMDGKNIQVVGVVGNVSQMGLDGAPMPQMYFPHSQMPSNSMVVLLRTTGDPVSLIPAVRSLVRALDPNLPIQSLQPFEESLGATLRSRRFTTTLLGVFAVLAIVLAAIGIYGVLNYWVSVRNREIAVRLALGAQRAAILRWAASHAAILTGLGIVFGVSGAWAASRWLESLVYGVSVRDPRMMVAAAAAILLIACIAATWPLRRALKVDVVRNLHDA